MSNDMPMIGQEHVLIHQITDFQAKRLESGPRKALKKGKPVPEKYNLWPHKNN